MATDDWEESELTGLENRDPIERDRIFVKNIPEELNDDGLKNIFEHYGHIKDKIHRPTGKNYAFVPYGSIAEAENCLRRFNIDHPALPIIVDFARIRDNIQAPVDYDFPDTPIITSEKPIRNVLELSKRRIQQPFGDPADAHVCDSLIMPKDYGVRKLCLLAADPTKEFLWNSNDEANIECEIKNKKIVHGRAISNSSLNANADVPLETRNTEENTFSFNSDLLPAIKRCANCQRPADKFCKNCEQPQCTLECHKASCLKNVSENAENVSTKSKTAIPSKISAKKIDQIVKITAVINHRMVFIRPATDRDDVEFVRLLCDTIKYAKDADTLKSMPSIGSLVLAKFDHYQRALVLKEVDETHVAVAFIDFGNIETCAFHELKFMPDELKKKKRFATKVQLNHIDQDILNDEALKVLYTYMANGIEMKFEAGPYNTDMKVITGSLKASDKWINQLVNKMNIMNIKRRMISTISERMFHRDFVFKPRDDKQMVGKEIIILDNSQVSLSDLSFVVADELKLFRENDRRVQNVCNYLFDKDEYYTPMETECCVLKFKGRWYRAYCLEICHDGYATMEFIDHGNMKLIEINDIRAIPECLLFESITITADCFSDKQDLEDIYISDELKKQYPMLSRQTIERMETRPEDDIYSGNRLSIVAWLKKKP